MSQKGIKLAKQWIDEADGILITASNGFAITEGLNLFTDNPEMRESLGDLYSQYHFPNLLTAFQGYYPDELSRWEVQARIADYFSYGYQDSPVMTQLKTLIKDKDYFIWTSNTDHHFILSGLENTFEIEGNWLEGICDNGHRQNISGAIHQIAEKSKEGTLLTSDIPLCQDCQLPLQLNLPGRQFQMNQTQLGHLRDFLANHQGNRLLVLELGIGARNQLIKAPSMEIVASHPNHRYITINKGEVFIDPSIGIQSIGIDSLLSTALEELKTGSHLGSQVFAPKGEAKKGMREAELMKLIYPSMTVTQGNRYSGIPKYVTIDSNHPTHFHAIEIGQSVMYSLGDAAIAHCITPDGQYYTVHLGLDKSKQQVHGCYIEAGTYVAFEVTENSLAGFSQLNISSAVQANDRLLVPSKEQLIEAFPQHHSLFERLAISEV